MSNTSIAAFPLGRGQACLDLVRENHPQWQTVLNPARYVPEANVMILDNASSTLVWLCSPQIEDWNLYRELAIILQSSWLQLFFQEHIVWEYNLYDTQQNVIDRFEPLPSLWGHAEASPGSAELVAGIWQIPPARINRYLKPWHERLTRRKAYWCRDESRYRNFEQGFDFLRSLTGLETPPL